MSESSDVSIAVQAERLKHIQEMLAEDRQDKKEFGIRVEQMFTLLSSIENRVKALEEVIDEHSPVFEEIIQLKHEIAGAKRVTQWLWVALTSMIAIGISIKAELIDLFSR